MNEKELLAQLRTTPESIEFDQVMTTITNHYNYTPTRFINGEIVNEAGTNEGSCKLFSFAKLNGLSEVETLALFGRYYREDVLENPAGDDHGNIRNFILDGWLGIQFDREALITK